MNRAVHLHVQGHAVWTFVSTTCSVSAVYGMGAGLLFALIVTNNMLLQMCFKLLNCIFLCFKMCAHLGTFLKSLQFYTFISSKYIIKIMLYLLFHVMMMMLFYLYICNYAIYSGP